MPSQNTRKMLERVGQGRKPEVQIHTELLDDRRDPAILTESTGLTPLMLQDAVDGINIVGDVVAQRASYNPLTNAEIDQLMADYGMREEGMFVRVEQFDPNGEEIVLAFTERPDVPGGLCLVAVHPASWQRASSLTEDEIDEARMGLLVRRRLMLVHGIG